MDHSHSGHGEGGGGDDADGGQGGGGRDHQRQAALGEASRKCLHRQGVRGLRRGVRAQIPVEPAKM